MANVVMAALLGRLLEQVVQFIQNVIIFRHGDNFRSRGKAL